MASRGLSRPKTRVAVLKKSQEQLAGCRIRTLIAWIAAQHNQHDRPGRNPVHRPVVIFPSMLDSEKSRSTFAGYFGGSCPK